MWSWRVQSEGCRLSRFVLSTLLMLGLLMSLSGCTRRFFRRRADAEVDEILAEKDKYPQWKINDYYVYPHPLSRFADPTDPDRPPMPPDDPAAWDMAPHPQRPWLKGYKYWQGTGYIELMRRWDTENRAKQEAQRAQQEEEAVGEEARLMGEIKSFAERAREVEQNIEAELAPPVSGNQQLPVSLDVSGLSSNKPFLLNLEQITELGFLNSPQFQAVRENLYLTALAVTAERFAFIAQPFVTEQVIRQRAGTKTGATPLNGWISSATAGFTKTFSTGALLLFNFANQTVYNLGGGGGKTTSVSTINLDIVQPFLAGGGRAVALEPLTQAERDLVYAIRDFYRFRQEYYAFFAVGQSTAFIPGVGAGVVALLPGTVNTPIPFVPGPFTLPLVNNPATVQVSPLTPLGANLNSGVLITPQGYLSAILERTVLFNYYKNIQALQRFLRIFDVWLQGSLVNQVQRGTVEQRLLGSYETILGQQLNFRVSLDQLKQQLGLPMTVPLDIAPGPLQPMINIIEAYEKLFINHQSVITTIDQYSRSTEARLLRGRFRRLLEGALLLRGTDAQKFIRRRLPYWENFAKDKSWEERKKALLDEIMKLRRELGRIRIKEAETPGEKLSKAEADRRDELKFELDMAEYELGVSIYEREEWNTNKEINSIRDEITREDLRTRLAKEQFFGAHRIFLSVVDHAVVERLRDIKNLWPDLLPVRAKGVDVLAAPEDEALLAVEQATFENRVDLMNVRAQLTDAWRKIRVAANALMGTFNVDYHLGATTPVGRGLPFAFSGSRTTHQLIFTGQLPLVRILQRNNYRSTLINFQQNRRSLFQFEDQLLFNVRFDLRQVRVLANNYQRVQKRQIELAYMVLDQALQAFAQPQAPPGADTILPGLVGPVGQRPQLGDPAALTTQLLGAQNSLVGSQNDLYSTWITFQINRTYLYRDMGVMPLDNRGVWIDADATANQPADDRSASGQQPPGNAPNQPGPEQLPQPRPEPAAQGTAAEPAR
ncbi:MAG TPA: hypothetical protein VE999_00805 [Gemmataceae bacterium]|nr:hypothetical protein [Gemmataceae bacterium]